jgi:hypothetical protein
MFVYLRVTRTRTIGASGVVMQMLPEQYSIYLFPLTDLFERRHSFNLHKKISNHYNILSSSSQAL